MTKSGGVVNRTRFVSKCHEHTGIAMLHVAGRILLGGFERGLCLERGCSEPIRTGLQTV